MRMVRPRLDAPQITIAENQEEFLPVTAALVRNTDFPAVPIGEGREANTLVLAFRPTNDERRQIAAGEDIYLAMLTFMRPMQGVILSVGPDGPATWFGVGVER